MLRVKLTIMEPKADRDLKNTPFWVFPYISKNIRKATQREDLNDTNLYKKGVKIMPRLISMEIDSCDACPFSCLIATGGAYRIRCDNEKCCSEGSRLILRTALSKMKPTDKIMIPIWCPLPTKEGD